MNLKSIPQYQETLLTITNVWDKVRQSKQHAIIFLEAPSGMKKTEIVLDFLKNNEVISIRSRGSGVPSSYLPFHIAYQSILHLDIVQQVINDPEPNQLAIERQRLLKTIISATPFLQPINIPDLVLTHQWQTAYQPTFELETSSDFEGHIPIPRPITLPNRLVATLSELASVSPILFFLDDLDLVDNSSLDALSRELLPALQSVPVLFLFTFGSASFSENNSLSTFIENLENNFSAEHISLSLLQEESVKHILRTEFANWEQPLMDELVSKIFSSSAGNLAQLKDLLGWLRQYYPEHPPLLVKEIPTHDSLMGKQFAQLGQLQKEILCLASCQGRYFCAEAVAKILGKPSQLVLKSLNKMSNEAGWVRADAEMALESQTLHWYRFHGRKRHEWIYRVVPEEHLAKYHRQTGEALETIYGQSSKQIADLLANQFEKAKAYTKAAEYLDFLANQANRQGDDVSAQHYAEKGLLYLQDNNGQELVCRLTAELGKAYQRSEKAHLAIDILEEAQKRATELNLGDELIIDIDYHLGQALLDSNRWDNGTEVLFRAVDKAIAVKNSLRAAEILESCRIAYYVRGNEQFLAECDRVITFLKKQSDNTSPIAIAEILEDKGWFFLERRNIELANQAFMEAFAVLFSVQEHQAYPDIFYKLYSQQASALRFKGEYSLALANAESAISWAIVCRRRDYEANGYMIKAIILDSAKDLENAELSFKKAIALLNTHSNLHMSSKVAEMYGLFLSQTGRKKEALEQYQAEYKYSILSNNERQAQVARNDIAAIHTHLGLFSEALATYQQLLNEGIAQEDIARQIVSLNHMGDIYRIQGNLVNSEKCHTQALQLCDRMLKLGSKLISLRYLMRTYIAGYKYVEAKDAFNQLHNLYNMHTVINRDYYRSQIYLYRLHLLNSAFQESFDGLMEVVGNLEKINDLFWLGLAYLNVSLCQLLLGKSDESVGNAQAALSALETAGSWRSSEAHQLLARCHLALGNLEEAQTEIVEAKSRFMQLKLFHRVTETENIETAIEIAKETNYWEQWREFTTAEIEQAYRYVGL
ncbi:MAG: AAA family ATPase [Anaerolineaceae bacterium]|nr:AAA family ATPase [Anaerolineaceae bacterium]